MESAILMKTKKVTVSLEPRSPIRKQASLLMKPKITLRSHDIDKTQRNLTPCVICSKESHHTDHIDGNHKNNDPKNLQRLCTLCHAKKHNIEPKISKLKWLVIQ